MMVHFRKRVPVEEVAKINEYVCTGKWPEGQRNVDCNDNTDDGEEPPCAGGEVGFKPCAHKGKANPNTSKKKQQRRKKNRSKLILDATVAPADIKYPTDIDLLNKSREHLETTVGILWKKGDVPHTGHTHALSQRLADYHIYSELLRLDWEHRFSQARSTGQASPENASFVTWLEELPEQLTVLQKQGLALIKNVLDTDSPKKPVDMKMTEYYLSAEQTGEDVFRFRSQQTSFEFLHQEVFGEVLCPDTMYDLIDYHLRECVKREIRMRVYKNCKRYFAVTGHGGTEYCIRVFDSKGRTCKEIGAVTQWTKSKSGDVVFKEYRREYSYVTTVETVAILEHADADFEEGKLYAIVGPSGSGKTTTLTLAGALEAPQGGEILYRGQDIQEIGYGEYRNRNVGVVFQAYNLLTYLTPFQNVMAAMEITRNDTPNRKTRAEELLGRMGLARE